MPDQHDAQHDDRDRRIETLRSLARQSEQQTSAPATPPPASPRRSRKALLLAAISALVLVAVVGALIAHTLISASSAKNPQQAHTTRTFDPKASNVSCPMDIVWSPNGATVAILGYESNCPISFPEQYSYHPGVIALYDLATGKVTNTIQPDPLVINALHLKPPTIATPAPYASPSDKDISTQVVDYAHLLWSPDGKQLAVTFSVLIGTAILNNGGIITKSLQGVLLMSPSDGQPRVLSHTLADGEYYSGLWNLATGAYIPPTAEPPSRSIAEFGWSSASALSQPALRYQWGDDGRLQPMTPLNATNAPVGQPDAPIGQPDGGNDFSVWQPGTAQVITRVFSDDPTHTPQQLKTPIETWQSSFGAWSPDGKYLLADGSLASWRIAITGSPAPDSATLAKVGLVGAPVLPTRDAGLAAALHSYHDVSLNPDAQFTAVNLAWSLDGKRLAVEAPVPDVTGQRLPQVKDFAVHIYDCASGKLLETLTPNLQLAHVTTGFQVAPYLRWSPDGSHLLVYDLNLDGAQIWGPDELPR